MTTQINQPTQAEMDAFNEKWRKKTEEQFAPLPMNEFSKEYWNKINSMPDEPTPIQFSEDEAKKMFWKYLKVLIAKPESVIAKYVAEEKSYREACTILTHFIFGIPNPKLEGKGGIYLSSAPGLGKTMLMGAAINCANIIWKTTRNPNATKWQIMPKDISLKLKGENDIDLTYSHESNLFLDDMTEKINQVSHFGDYKYSLNEIFQNRYELWKSKGLRTLISSNIVSDEIGSGHPGTLQSLLDGRSKDRFREMFCVIELFGKSKRV